MDEIGLKCLKSLLEVCRSGSHFQSLEMPRTSPCAGVERGILPRGEAAAFEPISHPVQGWVIFGEAIVSIPGCTRS